MTAYRICLLIVMLLSVPIIKANGEELSFGERLCHDTEQYHCYITKQGATWERIFPNLQQRDFVKRLNRVNIEPYPNMIFAIPKVLQGLNSYSPFNNNMGSSPYKTIIVDPTNLAWGAFDKEGKLIRWGPASLGKDYCSDVDRACRSPIGEYMVYRKGEFACKSNKYPLHVGGAPMPYCMFFKGGFAIHGSNEVPGVNASHGCVRVSVEDAQWLSQNFVDLPKQGGTIVSIKPYTTFGERYSNPS